MSAATGDRTHHRLAGTVLGGAALITVMTVLARLAGFGRIWVFSHTIGLTGLADIYQSINTIPNILYEIVAGGVLASLVVPLLAKAVADGDREHVDATASGLLTWTVLALTPVAVVVALAADPITSVMLGDGASDRSLAVGASMLRVFAPQIVLYGIGVVLTGILQAHKRFGGPALAPLLSSLVVIGAYISYAVVAPSGTDVPTLTRGQELVLSVGTTLGVVVLSLSLALPASVLGLRLRPRLTFPTGVAGQVRALAYAGAAALTAQQLAVLVALLLGNRASEATVVQYAIAQTIFFLPWAILAVPVATSVFPRLAQLWGSGARRDYADAVASSTIVVVVLSLAASAALAAAARPIARVMAQGVPGVAGVDAVTAGVVAFSFGLIGYSLFALLSRALYAAEQMASTAIACVFGWLTAIVADLVLSAALPADDRVLALALGNSIGMIVLGTALVIVVGRTVGSEALARTGRVTAWSVVASVLAGLAGVWLSSLLDGGGPLAAVGQGLLVAAATTALFGAVVALTARGPIVTALHSMRGGAGQ